MIERREQKSLKFVNPKTPEGGYGLALHTTTPDLGLALGDFSAQPAPPGNPPLRMAVIPLGREMAATLHSHLQAFLAPQTWSDLAFLAVAKGPGGFTGTRLGMVTARTIAQQLQIPLFAFSTLETIALYIAHTETLFDRDLAVTLPAQRGQLFGAIYRCSWDGFPPQTLFPDQVLSLDEWQSVFHSWPQPLVEVKKIDQIAESVFILLTLAQRYRQLKDPALSHPHWLQALPFYGQHPVQL
jgi:tRNA threonylcarbamoyl adenosine modification protein YeaZ